MTDGGQRRDRLSARTASMNSLGTLDERAISTMSTRPAVPHDTSHERRTVFIPAHVARILPDFPRCDSGSSTAFSIPTPTSGSSGGWNNRCAHNALWVRMMEERGPLYRTSVKIETPYSRKCIHIFDYRCNYRPEVMPSSICVFSKTLGLGLFKGI